MNCLHAVFCMECVGQGTYNADTCLADTLGTLAACT